MAPQRMMSDLDYTKTQLGIFIIVLLLAVDSINPVKIFMQVFPSFQSWHIALLCIALMTYVFISEMKPLLYFGVKIFFNSILSIFFRDVQVVGRDNIPRHGPVIYTVNHANQFIDAVMVLATCEHKISYLMAYTSWKRRIIGDIAWALDVVPVKRAQDDFKKGIGTVTMKLIHTTTTTTTDADDTPSSSSSPRIQVTGIHTKFTQQLKVGDKIRPPGTAIALKTTKIISDTEVIVEATDASKLQLPETAPGVSFDILPKVDQKVVYEKVLDKLASGGTVGIFPEGGSHDRTDLLPLKVGIALIAYSALEKDGINVPIVPIGLNYFQGHKFRGRAVVEYGRPIYIDPTTLPDFTKGGGQRRHVCNELLARIEDAMKSVLTTMPDYQTLQYIHTARRLYQRKESLMDVSEKQDMSRRFAEGYKRLMEIHEGTPPQDYIELQKHIKAYHKELQELGIRDYQVAGLDREETEDERDSALRTMRLPYQILHMLFCMAIAALPILCLNLPVGLISRLYAERRRKRALARSKVKIHARDVMMTEKVVLSIVLVPTFWVMYAFLFYFFISDRNGPETALFTLSMPLFSYTSIIVAESGMVEMKDIRPYLMRLIPSTRRRLAALPATRKAVQKELRTFVKKLGPSLGELYYGKDLDWNAIQAYRRQSDTRRKESEVDLKNLLKTTSTEPALQEEEEAGKKENGQEEEEQENTTSESKKDQ